MKFIDQSKYSNKNIIWDEDLGAWALCQYADIVKVLDSLDFSAAAANMEHQTVLLPTEDAPPAARQETMKDFQRKSSWVKEVMKLKCEEFCEKQIEKESFDLQREIIKPCCEQIAIDFCGINEENELNFLQDAQAIFMMNDEGNRKKGEAATVRLSNYFLREIAQKKHKPGNDFVSILAQNDIEPYVLLSPLIQMFVGVSTSLPLLIGNVMCALLSDSGQQKMYLKNPKESVSELLRFAGPAQIIYRIVLKDTIINQHKFKRGDKLALVLNAANYDSSKFENAETLDLNRKGVAHLSFGKGNHVCLGAPIIRVCVEIVPFTILSTLSPLELYFKEIQWSGSSTIKGVDCLPVHKI